MFPTFLLLFLIPSQVIADDITIGVRAHSGEQYAIDRWTPTIEYLQNKIPEHTFHLHAIPKIKDMETLVSNGKLDFVLTQPVAYVDLARLYGVTRLLTMQTKGGTTKFGSVIIARVDNQKIQSLEDIKGASIAGVTPKGFGGWLIGYEELQKHGIQSQADFAKVDFVGTQENVVNSVLSGENDAGIIRTGIIERLSSRGQLSQSLLKILNPQTQANFPYQLSTRLYPEWAFAKTNEIPPFIAKKVAGTLLALEKNSQAAIKGEYSEWSIPLDYSSVHELMKNQKVGSLHLPRFTGHL